MRHLSLHSSGTALDPVFSLFLWSVSSWLACFLPGHFAGFFGEGIKETQAPWLHGGV